MPKSPRVVHGDCLDIMKMLPNDSVDSIVTDPPYGLGFMGKAWDALPPGEEWAAECLRVLKPGGHLLAFGGTRTWHRLAVAVEDAGFEIRDSIAWLYSSGMPKSLDVSKAIDKGQGQTAARARTFQAWMRGHLTPKQINEATGTDMGHHFTTHPTQPAVATAEIFDKLRSALPPVPEAIERLVAERSGIEWSDYLTRPILGTETMVDTSLSRLGFAGATFGGTSATREVSITAASSEAAREWQGWGTALKPAFEPAVVARKPISGTVAATVLEFGTGAINIDATRNGERWPANVILDESQAEALAESKYFYTPKASKAERPVVDGIAHPTVKPLALMRWLVRLVTPEGGTVLEPFAGSGATVEACILEGFHCIAIEREAEYLPLIQARIDRQDAA